MAIPTYHLPWQDQAEVGNKSVKMPTDFTDETSKKTPESISTAEKQTAGRLGSSDVKDVPSSYINDH